MKYLTIKDLTMADNTDILSWLSNWFASECNGDWEHENQIKIQTLDNPGWDIEIDLRDTSLEELQILNDVVEPTENDWYFFEVRDKRFIASGDLTKLTFLLEKFKEIVESQDDVKVS